MEIIGYNTTIYFKDQPDTPVENMLIWVGDPKSEKEDEKVFFYIDSAGDILNLRSNLGSEDFVVTSWEAVYTEESVSEWDFVEQHYPNYSSSDDICRANDLHKEIFDNNNAGSELGAEYDFLMKDVYEKAIHAFQLKEAKRFPNGFEDWQETHFEMVASITSYMDDPFERKEIPNILSLTEAMQGLGGLYELASDWTTEFELMHKGKQWGIDDETEYREAIDKFLDEKYKK